MNLIELIILAAIWGASFLFMRIGTPEFGPIVLAALRVSIGSLVLLPVLRTASARAQLRQFIGPLLILGLTNSALPFCLFTYSTLALDAGFDSILNATTPLWGAFIAYVWLRVPLTRIQILGLAGGLIGVIILVVGRMSEAEMATEHGVSPSLAIGAVLSATLLYAFATNYSKHRLAAVAPNLVAFSSQFFAALTLLPLAWFYWPQQPIAASTWYAVSALGILCSGIAYLLYFRLVAHAGASYAMSVAFLVPIFGTLWGVCFLGEQITVFMMVGCAIILAGTGLASGKIKSLTFPVTRR
ncbi:DMT family transporter [Mycoavidus sp. B2-EB]|uniref:DMT family transporter n=1 Tax=Mycoavidus sp. B2-EB TaxID=2651972 RepID=UPI0016268514|nr:DMT family transporter [Mycoavidus sp. B2-EB]